MLSEREQSYYAELFQTCDVDGTGKFSGGQVSELFRASGLTQDVLLQITELCGAKRLGHFGRSQFYIALKLIAAVQFGLPVTTESINSGVDVPLPKFHKVTPNESGVQYQQSAESVAAMERQAHQGQLPPPPTSAKKSHGRNLSGQFRGLHPDQLPLQIPAAQLPVQIPASQLPVQIPATQLPVQIPATQLPVQIPATQLPVQIPATQPPVKDGLHSDTKSPPFSPCQPISAPAQTGPVPAPLASAPPQIPTVPQSPPTSPQTAPSTANLHAPSAPVVNNFTGQPGSAPVHKDTTKSANQPAHVPGQKRSMPQKGTEEWARFESDDEKHGLLGHGKKEGWDTMKLPDFDSSSYSSDTESVEDVWSINDEQREYYMKQFQNIEPDINGHISGGVAKDFFEKSKLTNQELSKIWNLADLNRDGALSMEEFCIAMHLVVLRRNDIEIPDRIPFSLMPYNAFTNEDAEPFAADLPEGSTLKRLTPTLPPESHQWEQTVPESPQISSSEVSSPSITPANFDFMKPEQSDTEAHIVRPKAQRLSPDMMDDTPEVRPERGRAFSGEPANNKEPAEQQEPMPSLSGDGMVPESEHVPVTKQRSNTTCVDESEHGPVTKLPSNATCVDESEHVPVTKQRSNTTCVDESEQVPVTKLPSNTTTLAEASHVETTTALLHGRPRPLVKKNTVPGAMPGHILPPAPLSSQDHSLSVDAGQEPPAPPPRPGGPHNRSMSVDYKAPPAVPPRVTPKETGGGLDRMDSESKTAVAWDLLGEDFVDGSAERQAEFALAAQRQASRDKKELQMAIRTHKERNSTLSRLNSELNQELQEVMEQRIALEIQLEHLRPFSS